VDLCFAGNYDIPQKKCYMIIVFNPIFIFLKINKLTPFRLFATTFLPL
jgi:hypothetical protein